MDYEKLYNELKEKYDNNEITFSNYRDNIEKEKSDLQKEFDTYKAEAEKEITNLKTANIDLFLKVSREPQPEVKPPQEEKTPTCDDLIKDLL